MKNLILVGTLCAAMLAPTSVRAQETPVAPAPVDTTNGYELLLEAAKLIKLSFKVADLNRQPLPDNKLRRIPASESEAYSPLALDKLRAALKAGIVVPLPRYDDGRLVSDFPAFSASMALSRQLSQEAALRSADGDAMGAAQSGLDAMQLGAQIGRGLRSDVSTGMSVSTRGREILEKVAPDLDAAQSRDVATQLDAISAQTPQMTDVLQAELAYNLRSLNYLQGELSDPAKRATAEAQAEAATVATTAKNRGLTMTKDIRFTMTGALLEFPAAQIEEALQKSFDEATARAALPYEDGLRDLPKSGVLYVDIVNTMNLASPGRFAFARDIVANRQLTAALRLHADKLETGQYPETFDAGIDPFSPTFAPMVYKRAGENHVLYSVGPDGKDEDGAEIQTLTTDYRTSIKSVTGVLRYDSTGDIVAPVL